MASDSDPAPGQQPEDKANAANLDEIKIDEKTAKEAAQSVAQQAAEARKKAMEAADPALRKNLEVHAVALEKAEAQLKSLVGKFQSGALQGAVGGSGIGAASGLGLGAIIGTVVGGVTAVPTTILGGLVGTGAGLVHGPWIKVTGKDGEKAKGDDRAKDENGKDGKVSEDASTEGEPKQVEKSESQQADEAQEETKPAPKPRKAPRKIEIRSQGKGAAGKSDSHGKAD